MNLSQKVALAREDLNEMVSWINEAIEEEENNRALGADDEYL